MATVTIERLSELAVFLRMDKLSNHATTVAGKNVRVYFEKTNQCYSREDWYSGLNIRLGTKFYPDSFHETGNVPDTEVKAKYRCISTMYLGAYYHELFHVLYTAFQYGYEVTHKCPRPFQNFVHTVVNILEDITIEETGMYRYPYSEPFVKALSELFSQDYQKEMLAKCLTDEPDQAGTMLAYLLHYCRGTDLSSLPVYQLWEDNKEFIEKNIYKCINTTDAHLRVRRQVSFGLQLLKILNHQDPSQEQVDNPDQSTLEKEAAGIPIPGESSSPSAQESMKGLGNFTNVANDGPSSTTPEQTEEDISMKDPTKEQKASREDDEGGSSDEINKIDLSKEGIAMLANDEPVYNYAHRYEKLSKYFDTSAYLESYNKVVKKFDKNIRTVVALIRKMKSHNMKAICHYKMSGKFDISTIYKRGNYKHFMKTVNPSPEADLVFEILVDNSGSMQGSKAKLAGQALIIFCEALSRLHIPFSVDAFTEAHQAITISLKDFHETYDSVKTNMTLFTEQFEISQIGTWYGNIDEVNLQYVSHKLAERTEKDKVLLVISDGATCGSWEELKKLADRISASGVTMLGIGIYDSNVEKIYKNNIVLRQQEDLENLGGFLNKYLIGKIFK